MNLPTPNELIVTNLQLLGFNDQDFNSKSFHSPNEPLLYSILHFLFTSLDPKRCRKDFRDCWPVVTKETKAPFKRAAQVRICLTIYIL